MLLLLLCQLSGGSAVVCTIQLEEVLCLVCASVWNSKELLPAAQLRRYAKIMCIVRRTLNLEALARLLRTLVLFVRLILVYFLFCRINALVKELAIAESRIINTKQRTVRTRTVPIADNTTAVSRFGVKRMEWRMLLVSPVTSHEFQ